MSSIAFYTEKTTLKKRVVLSTTMLLACIVFATRNGFSGNVLIALIILVTGLIYGIYRLMVHIPALILTGTQIILPLKNEAIVWDQIKKIAFNDGKAINESITITTKTPDFSRKIKNVPIVFDDYDAVGHPDYAVYEIDLKNLKTEHVILDELILKLKRIRKTEREKLLRTMLRN